MKHVMMGMLVLCLWACDKPYNSPYVAEESGSNTYYTSFEERPRTLDPAKAYSSNEYAFIAQIYEPPLQYHYLLRPLKLIPLTASQMPKVTFLDAQNKPIDGNVPQHVAYTVYTITLKKGIQYQPHPALAKQDDGQFQYHQLREGEIDEKGIGHLHDFPNMGTRTLTADDYVYQIKRLAHPGLKSPIYGLMKKLIVGLESYSQELSQVYDANQHDELKSYAWMRAHEIDGVKTLDETHYQITLKGLYPQFIYWLAMPFFSPVPWEADVFYAQPDMDDANISMDWFPIGTGPYQLNENNPNRYMELIKNPNFHGEHYPDEGMPEDASKGLLKDAGKALPFVERVLFSLEKETIPRWNKFLQGYYDQSGISSDSFDEAIRIDENNQAQLSKSMQKQGIYLQTSVTPTIYYMGFNMLDPVVGGNSDRAKYLRQAIKKTLNFSEFISIFLNGRGVVANGPLPPGIFGAKPMTKTVAVDRAEAKALLSKAGYPNGIDPLTGKSLLLYYDVPASSGPDDKSRLNWYRKQFAEVGIDLQIRSTQYNRFQEKMRTGAAQIFSWGWHADYPDPENFLFLLYGPNSKVNHGGENAANYQNPAYDKLFDEMKNLPNFDVRAKLIQQMYDILEEDTPWLWGFYPKTFQLAHTWYRPTKPSEIANNTLKFAKIDPNMRQEKRAQWNQAVFWPILVFIVVILLVLIPVFVQYHRMIHKPKYR